MLHRHLLLTLGFLAIPFYNFAQTTIWSEDFSTYADGTMNAAKWTTSYFDMDDATINSGANYWGVHNGRFHCNDVEGHGNTNDNYWKSEKIYIGNYSAVSISVDLDYSGSLECGGLGALDEIETMYSVDGSTPQEFCSNGYLCGLLPASPTLTKTSGLLGDSLQIIIRLGNQANNENYFFDNVVVTGNSGASSVDSNITICQGDSTMIFGNFQSLPGTFYDTLQSSAGCDSITTIKLAVTTPPEKTAQYTICQGKSVSINGVEIRKDTIFNFSKPSSLTCDSIITAEVSVLPIEAQFSYDYNFLDSNQVFFQNNSNGQQMASIDFGDGESGEITATELSHSYAQGGMYQVTLVAINQNGCSDTLNFNVVIPTKNDNPVSGIFIPNCFTPNADGVNDFFEIKMAESMANLDFEIYNRWGQLIYQSHDPQFRWNGKFNGRDCSPGTYMYVLKTGEMARKGFLTLIR